MESAASETTRSTNKMTTKENSMFIGRKNAKNATWAAFRKDLSNTGVVIGETRISSWVSKEDVQELLKDLRGGEV